MAQKVACLEALLGSLQSYFSCTLQRVLSKAMVEQCLIG